MPRRRAAPIAPGSATASSTHAPRIESSCAATHSTTDGSVRATASTTASARPCRLTWLSGTIAVVSRRRTWAIAASTSAPPRSTLLTNRKVGTPTSRSARQMTTVCGWTPSTADRTRTAASRTVRDRSTSAMKSGWPGVSRTLTVRSPRSKEVTAARIVMPRRRSRSIESVRVVPSSTLPGASSTPASARRRSVRLVLPASTCARIPRLRKDMQQLHGASDGGPERCGCSHAGLLGSGC